MTNKQNTVKLNAQNCPKFSPGYIMGYMCTSFDHVTYLFLLGNTCSNHHDVTFRFVTPNSNCTLNQIWQQNIHYYSSEADHNLSKYFDKIIFENTNCLQWLNCLILNTPLFYLVFVIIILIRVCFLMHFQS